MSDGLGTPGGVVSDEDHRLALAGLISPQTSSLAVRTGVLIAPGSTALVTGTSATGTMTASIAAHHWVTTRGTGDGVYLGAKEAAGTVNIAAAPGANSRIDVVYVKQNDSASTISPDGSTGELYGVVTGTAAASPTKPALPVGAEELATVTVAVGATSTNGSGVTINNTARQTTLRGGVVLLRTAAELSALTAYPTAQALELDTGRRRWHDGTRWRYEGDHVTVASITQRNALTAYVGLQALDTSTGITWLYTGTWDVSSGPLPAMRVYLSAAVPFGLAAYLNVPFDAIDSAQTNDPDNAYFQAKLASTERRVLLKQSGLYQITYEGAASAADGNYGRIGLMTAGNTMGTVIGSAGPSFVTSLSRTVRLAANDHVGAALNTAGSALADAPSGYRHGLSIVRLSN